MDRLDHLIRLSRLSPAQTLHRTHYDGECCTASTSPSPPLRRSKSADLQAKIPSGVRSEPLSGSRTGRLQNVTFPQDHLLSIAHCSCCADGLRVPEVENLLGGEVVDNAATRRGVDRLGEEPVVIAAAIGEEYDVLARLGERARLIVHVEVLDLDLPRPYKLRDAADIPLEVLHGRDRIDLEPKAAVVKPCNAGVGVASCGNDVVHVPLEPHVFFSSLLHGWHVPLRLRLLLSALPWYSHSERRC